MVSFRYECECAGLDVPEVKSAHYAVALIRFLSSVNADMFVKVVIQIETFTRR